MIVLVCGGRHYDDKTTVWCMLSAYQASRGAFTAIVQGGATGADKLARGWAEAYRIPLYTFWADWKALGTKAGPIRNQRMLDQAKPSLVIAFPGGAGTENMKRLARQSGIEVIEVA